MRSIVKVLFMKRTEEKQKWRKIFCGNTVNKMHKANMKAKTWRESRFAYQIKETGAGDENCCSKRRTRTRDWKSRSTKKGKGKMHGLMIQDWRSYFVKREREKAGNCSKFSWNEGGVTAADSLSEPATCLCKVKRYSQWLKRRFDRTCRAEVKWARL